ncbi:MAG TPA: S-adenosylmethionine synthetase N-terminal domain-containing protein, partial [Burkholderiaceae bacterium]|nr:S-adenosylmethionine synthetase N-terminal domain-containing protein [Burkholderiaceae bacterium]
MASDFLFTSESVSEGHPDKVADRISDEVLDECLRGDPRARVAVETLVTRDRCVVAGEVTAQSPVDIEAVVRRAIRDIGYGDPNFGWETVPVEVLVHGQSPEIGCAVTGDGVEEGAGD